MMGSFVPQCVCCGTQDGDLRRLDRGPFAPVCICPECWAETKRADDEGEITDLELAK